MPFPATAAQSLGMPVNLGPPAFSGIGKAATALSINNVKLAGAAGDGTTDDSASIQALITALGSSGGIVYFPAGTYKIGTALTVSNSKIIFRGVGYASIIQSATQSLGSQFVVTGDDVTFEYLCFDGKYTSGAWTGDFGLINLNGGDRMRVMNCRFLNSFDKGIRIYGLCEDVEILGCRLQNCYLGIWACSSSSTEAPQRLTINTCTFIDGWSTDAQSGGIKIQTAYAHFCPSRGHVVSSNILKSCGEMGVEMWKQIFDSSVVGNTIQSVVFGISLDNATNVVVSGNSVARASYVGIEAGAQCESVLIGNNTVDMYSTGTTRAGTSGIITSNTTGNRVSVVGNRVRGCSNFGLHMQTTNDCLLSGNQVYDCGLLVSVKSCSRTVVKNNDLQGPCGYHLFVDITDGDYTDLDFSANTLSGLAANDNIIIYDGTGAHTLTRMTVRNNNLGAATTASLTINYHVPLSRLPYFICLDNYYDGTGSVIPDQGRFDQLPIPFAGVDQQYSIPTAKKFSITVPVNAGDTWYKVFSFSYGFPMSMLLHVECDMLSADNKASSQTFMVSSSPYGQDCNILKLPDGRYNGSPLKGLIYDNSGGAATQEIWIRLGPTGGGTVTVAGADFASSWIIAPTRVTSAPTYNTNSYEIDATANYSRMYTRYFGADQVRIPHTTAPVSPVNGDVWTTTAGMFTQINGTTVGPLGSGSGSMDQAAVLIRSFCRA